MEFSRIKPIYLITAILSVAVVIFAANFPLLSTDTACRHAPMAEAFADGNWAEAFHPRFGIGLQVLSGLLVFVTGMDGYAACAVMASLAWALCLIPLFRVAERVFDRKTAWLAVACFMIFPQALIWALKGLREPFKLLGILMAADVLVSLVKREGAVVAEGMAAVVLLVCFKVDGVLLAFLLVVAMLAIDRLGRRSLSVAAVALLALQPMCWLVYYWQGWWVPAPQYIGVIKRLMSAVGMGT